MILLPGGELARCSASSAVNAIFPTAAPGEAGSPLAITIFCALGLNVGCRSWSRLAGSTKDRGLLVDQLFLDHLHRDVHRGRRRPLAGAGLEHVQLALLDCELKVLHVLVAAFEQVLDRQQLAPAFLLHSPMRSQGMGVRMPATTSSPWALTRNSP